MKKNIPLVIFFALSLIIGKAQLSGYSFVKPITVSNSSGTVALNYQLKLNINTQALVSASQMLASGNDIRFGKTCNGASLYNYWIESGMNSTNTTIWVKIDSIPAGGMRTLFMFYGNSGAAAASSIPGVFTGPHSSTDSVASGGAGGVGNSQRGFRFSPNEDLLITAFGKMEPTGTTRYITLFDNATQTIVAQTQVSGPAGQYSYGNLANPFWVNQGVQYLLELYQGAADGYYFGGSSQIGQHLTYYDMRYCNGCSQNTFPTNVLTNYHYGYPDLWYWTKVNISPVPTYTIDAGPIVSVIQTTTDICPLTSVSFTASSSGPQVAFTWQPGNSTGSVLTVAPATSTTYSLIASYLGCIYSNTANPAVTVHPIPSVSISGNTLICGSGTNVLTASGASSYTWNTNTTGSNLSVSPAATTGYSVIGASAQGCTNTAAITITVDPIPVVSISGGNISICSGNTANLTASGASTYTWNTNATTAVISVSPGATTGYSVIGASVLGCTNSAATSVTVNITPTVSISGGNITICSGNSVGLTASGASTYTWNTNATASGISVSPGATSGYSVIGSSVAGCTNNAATNITVNITPTISISGGNVAICSGNSVNLAASGASTYTWNTNATTAGISVSPGATSGYSVVGSSVAGCTNSAATSITVNITPTVSISGGNVVICSGNTVNLTASGAATYTWDTNATTAGISVSPGATTNYSVLGMSAQGCTNSAASSITVNITPTVSITGGNINICSGNSASLIASGAATYTWDSNVTTAGIIVTPGVTTSYSVTGSSVEGCSSSAIADVTVNITPTVSIPGSFTICSGSQVTLTASGASTYTWSTNLTGSLITVSPGQTTTYSVIGESLEGCTALATNIVTVHITPTISVAGNTAICTGDQASLTASGATSYSWNTGDNTAGILVSPASNTLYTITGTTTAGCIGMTTQSVIVNPLPTVNATSGSTFFCIGETATLTASGTDTYSWNTSETSAAIVVSPAATTVYSVTGTNSLTGCSAVVVITQEVSECTGISKTAVEGIRLKLYPNPNRGIFTLEGDLEGDIVIYNVLGAFVHSQKHNHGKSEINIANLQNGVYFLSITDKGTRYQVKVIKE